MVSKDNLNRTLADAVMDRPREFFIGSQRYCLWSPTLGQSILIGRYLDILKIDGSLLKVNPSLAALSVVAKNRKEVSSIISILTFRGYEALCDSQRISTRAKLISDKLEDSELAQLLLIILNEPTADELISLSGLTEQHDEQKRIADYKNRDGHTLSFGGKTIYGMLIDSACRAYGWTKEYVVWGIDLISLRMMLSDNISSVYVTEDEAEALSLGKYEKDIIGMSKADFEELRNMDWS